VIVKYSLRKHNRRSIRLKGYDYTRPGAYFVTFCTQNRACILGEIVRGDMRLSPIGQIAHNFWSMVSDHFPNIEVDPFIVMPNHVHAIITIHEPTWEARPTPGVGKGVVPTPREDETTPGGRETLPLPNLGKIIAYYK
jgi:putative transposase